MKRKDHNLGSEIEVIVSSYADTEAECEYPLLGVGVSSKFSVGIALFPKSAVSEAGI